MVLDHTVVSTASTRTSHLDNVRFSMARVIEQEQPTSQQHKQ